VPIPNDYGYGPELVWFEDLQCTGNELSLAECRSHGWGTHDCSRSYHVAIFCSAGNDGKYYFHIPLTNSKQVSLVIYRKTCSLRLCVRLIVVQW